MFEARLMVKDIRWSDGFRPVRGAGASHLRRRSLGCGVGLSIHVGKDLAVDHSGQQGSRQGRGQSAALAVG
jgi:hypothetical protein